MHRSITPIAVLGASLVLAVPAFGKGQPVEPQWMQALEARSQELNRQHGLGQHDPALRALTLRSEALNRQYGLAQQAYPASTIAVNEAIAARERGQWMQALETRSQALNRQYGVAQQAYPASTIAVNDAIEARERTLAAGRERQSAMIDARERSFAAKRNVQLAGMTSPDVFERAVAAGPGDGGMLDRFIANDNRFQPRPTTTPVAVSSGSGSEIEWPQLGIGFAIGIALALGLLLALRVTRHRPLAH